MLRQPRGELLSRRVLDDGTLEEVRVEPSRYRVGNPLISRRKSPRRTPARFLVVVLAIAPFGSLPAVSQSRVSIPPIPVRLKDGANADEGRG